MTSEKKWKWKKGYSPNYIHLFNIIIISVEDNNIPDITQIAAVEFSSEELFCKYVRPEKMISSDAQKLTKINWKNGVLTYQGIPVDFVGIRTALNDFLDWLQRFDDVTLVAHCGLGFDFIVMGRALSSCDLTQRFYSKVAALCDSLDIMRDKHPGLRRYSQESLALHFCGDTYTAHNAKDDAVMLKEYWTMQAFLSATSKNIRLAKVKSKPKKSWITLSNRFV